MEGAHKSEEAAERGLKYGARKIKQGYRCLLYTSHFAVRQYKKFLLSAGKTRSSILISCGARLAPFDIRELRELMETDEDVYKRQL